MCAGCDGVHVHACLRVQYRCGHVYTWVYTHTCSALCFSDIQVGAAVLGTSNRWQLGPDTWVWPSPWEGDWQSEAEPKAKRSMALGAKGGAGDRGSSQSSSADSASRLSSSPAWSNTKHNPWGRSCYSPDFVDEMFSECSPLSGGAARAEWDSVVLGRGHGQALPCRILSLAAGARLAAGSSSPVSSKPPWLQVSGREEFPCPPVWWAEGVPRGLALSSPPPWAWQRGVAHPWQAQ